jgi:hypothetical protein
MFVSTQMVHRQRGRVYSCLIAPALRNTAEWFDAIAAIDQEVRAEGKFVADSLVYAGLEPVVSITRQAQNVGLRVFELNVGAAPCFGGGSRALSRRKPTQIA